MNPEFVQQIKNILKKDGDQQIKEIAVYKRPLDQGFWSKSASIASQELMEQPQMKALNPAYSESILQHYLFYVGLVNGNKYTLDFVDKGIQLQDYEKTLQKFPYPMTRCLSFQPKRLTLNQLFSLTYTERPYSKYSNNCVDFVNKALDKFGQSTIQNPADTIIKATLLTAFEIVKQFL